MTAASSFSAGVRGFVETAPDAIIVANPDTGEIVEANQSAEGLFGYSRDELLGMEQPDLHPADETERYRQLFQLHQLSTPAVISQFDGGSPVYIETAAGERIAVEINAWLISTDEGEFIQGVFRDISVRRQRARRLNQYREAIESTTDMIAAVDETFDYLFVNSAYCEPLGCDEGEIVGRSVPEVLGEETFESIKPRLEQALAGEELQYEMRRTFLSGETRALDIRYSPLVDQTGDVYGVVGSVRDITEREQREQELRESEARYRSLTDDVLDTSNVATIILDSNFEVVWVNRATEEYFGADREALIGEDKRTQIEAWLKDIFERPDRFTETVLATYDDNSYVENFECHVLPAADRGERWLEHWSRPIETGLYEGGRIEHYQDITPLKRTQHELERTNDRLRVLNRIVRHDIRNDMNIVAGWSEQLGGHVDAEGEAILDRIQSTSQHVIDLTKTVRDYVEVIGTDERPDLEPTLLDTYLSAELDKRRDTYPDAAFEVEGEIPGVEVRANELLASVFRNVLNNAVQHNDTDRPRVSVSVDETAETVLIRIADNGPGIPDGQKEAIFGRGETGLDDPAAGIGLYLVDTLVSEFGGDVWVDDNDPTGAVFVIELPKSVRAS